MDFECEGVEATEVAESYGETIDSFANIYTEMMWSSGDRPSNKKARAYIDTDIETTEENAIEEYPNDEDMQTEYMMEQWNTYAPFIRVKCSPRYFKNSLGFEICDLDISMSLISYNGAEVVKYEPKIICFSVVTRNEKINPNYINEDDFEFEGSGIPVEEEIIEEYIRQSIADYVKEF